MGRKSTEFSEEVKHLIVTLKREKHKTSEIVHLLRIIESTERSIWNKSSQRGNVENLPRKVYAKG